MIRLRRALLCAACAVTMAPAVLSSLPASAAWAARTAAGAEPGPRPEERRLLSLVNKERALRKLPPLEWNPVLARLARAHAADMRSMRQATHHSSADGADFTRRLARSELRARAAAENVAFAPDVERAHRGLMDSPGHRRNILDGGLTAIGIGILRESGGDGLYVVQDFAMTIAELSGEEAAEAVRRAVAASRRRSHRPALAERPSWSERLAGRLESLIKADSVDVEADVIPGPAWVIAYTTPDPGRLPDEVTKRLRDAGGFALAAAFRRTPSYPFGTYWVILALTGDV